MHREADGARLVGNGAADGLANRYWLNLTFLLLDNGKLIA